MEERWRKKRKEEKGGEGRSEGAWRRERGGGKRGKQDNKNMSERSKHEEGEEKKMEEKKKGEEEGVEEETVCVLVCWCVTTRGVKRGKKEKGRRISR